MDELERRIKIALNTECKSNCIGTAAFLARLTEEESHIESDDFFRKFYDKLKIADSPERGYIISWEIDLEGWVEFNRISHMGIVYKINPLIIVHRNGILKRKGGQLEDGDGDLFKSDFEEFNKINYQEGEIINYYCKR